MVLESHNGDSVWNFHVWNDCWMARPDLPPGYGGWQALDATPQERSEGVYWTGPAPLAAVKQGHVYYGYDTGFVFAEVNADRIDWECTTFKGFVTKMKARNVQKSAVGKFISTKAVIGNDREDITHLYKFSEDSEENRMAVACAIEHGSRPNTYDTDDGPDDVQFEIETDDMVTVGDDYDVRIKVVNKSNEKRTVDVYIASHVCHYTGIPVKNSKCKDQHIDLVLEPNSSSEAVKRVVCSDYLGKLADQSAMKIYAMGKVRETKQMWADQDDFRLRTPDLTLETEGPLQVGKEFTLKIYLKNPIPSTLSQCTVSIEGPGLQKPKKVRHNNIIPHGDMKMEVKLTPRKAGNRVIMASFDSKQLDNITGSLDLKIAPRA
uniref:Protein-glutamine gamma-glutamyltransferase K-like n=1 Tax=Saccoglossus kowalevskii TaxID=10224 RepID=A0ABM0M2B6_SACKO|nr:PREDICTED: protein-glutamine gamma-glutamyltransferase K-like [Saccoglossus kowalevskii]